MGSNAQRRRSARDAVKDRAGRGRAHVMSFVRSETKTVERLRAALTDPITGVKTRAQLEEMIRQGDPATMPQRRRLLEQLAPQDLPCCGKGLLAAKTGQPLEHHPLCPVAGRVVLT